MYADIQLNLVEQQPERLAAHTEHPNRLHERSKAVATPRCIGSIAVQQRPHGTIQAARLTTGRRHRSFDRLREMQRLPLMRRLSV